MDRGAGRRISAAIAAVILMSANALVASAGQAASRRTSNPAPASVVVDNRRITAPAGAYQPGAQFGAMSVDGTHVFLNSLSMLGTTNYTASDEGAPFDDVAGRIARMIDPRAYFAEIVATSADGSASVLEESGRSDTGDPIDLYLLHDGVDTRITPSSVSLHFVAMSADGSTVVFRTISPLAPSDTDTTEDLYAWHRATGTITHVSAGTRAPTFVRISADGSRIVFTAFGMVGQPQAGTEDVIYERTAAGLVARGRGRFVDESADGARLYFDTVDALVPEDRDTSMDGYVNSAVGDRVLTEPSAMGIALVAVSADGAQWVETTIEALTPDDTDRTIDVYLGTPTGATLLSRGDADATWDGTDATFTTGIYETASALVADDGDNLSSVYRIALDDPGHPELISGGGGGNKQAHAIAYAPDGSRALLISDDPLLPGDTDQLADVYEWAGGTLHLVTIGDAEAASVKAWTPDLRRVVFESMTPLTSDVSQVGMQVYISDADMTPPVAEVTSPGATTGPDVSIPFGTHGGDGTWFDCSIDGAAWTHCSSPFTAYDLADGPHALTVRAWDAAANMDEATTSWTVDRAAHPPTGPTATFGALPAWLTSTAVSLRWGAAAGSSPVTTYDVRYRRAAWNGGFSPFVAWRFGTTAKSGSITGAKGSTYCFSARAYDVDGLVSAWSAESCTVVPLDDRSLAHTASWSLGTGTADFAGTYLRSSTPGASLTRPGVVTRRIDLVATACHGCGSVRVYWNGALVRTISLESATTVHRKLLAIATFGTTRTGTLVIVVVGSRPVLIDGLATRH